MINCDVCHKPTAPHEKPVVIVSATRARVYPVRKAAPKYPGAPQDIIDNGGTGSEIVSEIRVHAGKCEIKARRKLEGGAPPSIGLDAAPLKSRARIVQSGNVVVISGLSEAPKRRKVKAVN